MLKKLFTTGSIVCLLGACSTTDEGSQNSYPKSREDKEWERVGKITGEEGLVLAGSKGKSTATSGINVNSFLWRAALDAVHKMPLLAADPFGGTILTDWYKPEPNAKERYKLNVFIIGSEFRSDGVRVTAFKQKLDGKGGWVDVPAPDELSAQIEDKILLTARNIKFSAGSQ